ncbi:MAG: FAD-binding oxidoreductase [Mobilitalea sp.]
MNEYLLGLTGRIVTPYNPIYNEARNGFNRAISRYPLIIVYCQGKRDVSNAILWARRNEVAIRIRNGKHNYEGYSNGDSALIIDVSEMNGIKFDSSSKLLYLEGGVTNQQVYNFISSRQYPFPGGTCPTVGVSGYVLGGGWGLSCRLLGLGCDSLIEIELIDYEGSTIVANRNQNSDLFWACCGAGGGNFGVIVSMTFTLPPRIDQVTLIEIDYLNVKPSVQREFLNLWQNWLEGADPRITLISRIYHTVEEGLSMLVRGIFYGELEEAKELMKEFISIESAQYNIETMSFLEAVTIIGSSYPAYEKFKSVSRFVLRKFTVNEIEQLTGMLRVLPNGSEFAGLSMYALGGRVSEVPRDATAFYYRNARYIIWLETIWEENQYAEDNSLWIAENFPYLQSITTGSYVNFPYSELPDYQCEYFGDHVKELIRIKLKYDPQNIFSFPQGILPDCYQYINGTISSIDNSLLQKREESEFNSIEQEKSIDNSNSTIKPNYRGFRYVNKTE